MNLRSQSFELSYRTHDGPDPVTEFFVPCLRLATKYDRAVGFFSSSSLKTFESGIQHFVDRKGRIRLVTSPRLSEEDIEQIKRGVEDRQRLDEFLARDLESIAVHSSSEVGYLYRLIRDGTLEVRIAYMRNEAITAMYHEKIGLFYDDDGNCVFFNGSANESANGLVHNAESIYVNTSWSEGSQTVNPLVLQQQDYFERLWGNQIETVRVCEPGEATFTVLKDHERNLPDDWLPPVPNPDMPPSPKPPIPPVPVRELRPYQRSALAAWVANGNRGVLNLATGTGKTFTAIVGMEELSKALDGKSPLLVVVTAPTLNLVDQWISELGKAGYSSIRCCEGYGTWADQVALKLIPIFQGRGSSPVILVTTEATWGLKVMQDLIQPVNSPFLFVGDEAHGLVSEAVATSLPSNANFRLGLSATPLHYRNEENNDRLRQYFGDIVFTFDLGQAIREGYLCQYRYQVRISHLTDEELDQYQSLSAQLAWIMSNHGGQIPPKGHHDHSLFMTKSRLRNAVREQAVAKLSMLKSDVDGRRDQYLQLVYCSEGKSPLYEERQFDDVKRLLGLDLGITIQEITHETSAVDRQRLLKDFASAKTYQALVAMRTLDEGVDIPDARMAYLLASSHEPRQWVQRRGRILRKPSDGSEKVATIVDYASFPSPDANLNEAFRNLAKNELDRIREFAMDAVNREEILDMHRELSEQYSVVQIESEGR